MSVYYWGGGYNNANLTEYNNLTKNYIRNSESVVGTSGEEFNVKGEKLLQNPISFPLAQNTIRGLYTSGGVYTQNGEDYMGYYHYHKDTRQTMTGFTHGVSSLILKKNKLGRE